MIRLVMIHHLESYVHLSMLQTAAPAGLPLPISPGGNPFAGYITHHVPGSHLNRSACIFLHHFWHKTSVLLVDASCN